MPADVDQLRLGRRRRGSFRNSWSELKRSGRKAIRATGGRRPADAFRARPGGRSTPLCSDCRGAVTAAPFVRPCTRSTADASGRRFTPPEDDRHDDAAQTRNRHADQTVEIESVGVRDLPGHLQNAEAGDAARHHGEHDHQDPGPESGKAQQEGKRQGGVPGPGAREEREAGTRDHRDTAEHLAGARRGCRRAARE